MIWLRQEQSITLDMLIFERIIFFSCSIWLSLISNRHCKRSYNSCSFRARTYLKYQILLRTNDVMPAKGYTQCSLAFMLTTAVFDILTTAESQPLSVMEIVMCYDHTAAGRKAQGNERLMPCYKGNAVLNKYWNLYKKG